MQIHLVNGVIIRVWCITEKQHIYLSQQDYFYNAIKNKCYNALLLQLDIVPKDYVIIQIQKQVNLKCLHMPLNTQIFKIVSSYTKHTSYTVLKQIFIGSFLKSMRDKICSLNK